MWNCQRKRERERERERERDARTHAHTHTQRAREKIYFMFQCEMSAKDHSIAIHDKCFSLAQYKLCLIYITEWCNIVRTVYNDCCKSLKSCLYLFI
jgi:hypothetical protein